MTDFNEFLEKINGEVKKWIIRLYQSFDTYAYYYYYEDNRFAIDDNPRNTDAEYYETHVVYRNDEDWFRTEFLVYLNDIYLNQLYYNFIETPLITKQNVNIYFNELSELLTLVNVYNNNELDLDMSIEYIKYYANNILTFEDFKTLLYEREIYNDIFADDVDIK